MLDPNTKNIPGSSDVQADTEDQTIVNEQAQDQVTNSPEEEEDGPAYENDVDEDADIEEDEEDFDEDEVPEEDEADDEMEESSPGKSPL